MKDWKKDFLLKCQHVSKKNHDLKIRNIRPSEDLTVEFINSNIEQ